MIIEQQDLQIGFQQVCHICNNLTTTTFKVPLKPSECQKKIYLYHFLIKFANPQNVILIMGFYAELSHMMLCLFILIVVKCQAG